MSSNREKPARWKLTYLEKKKSSVQRGLSDKEVQQRCRIGGTTTLQLQIL